MNWISGRNEEPANKPEDELPIEAEKHEESTEQNENGINPDASPIETIEEQKPQPIPEPASTQLTFLKSEDIDELKTRWNLIQIEFVDEPRKSVEQADALVAEALKRVEQAFTEQRAVLEERWVNHEEISTEDLRISLQSYRSFFNRFLTF